MCLTTYVLLRINENYQFRYHSNLSNLDSILIFNALPIQISFVFSMKTFLVVQFWKRLMKYTTYMFDKTFEPRHEISNNVVCTTSKALDQPVHTHSLIRAFASRLNILWVLSYWLNIIGSFWALKEAAQTSLSLHLSKCHIVWKHMSWLNFNNHHH